MASGHRIAAEAGIAALRVGGSAVDAALAAAFTQWVVNAPQCGPGGEMVVLVANPAGGGNPAHTSTTNGDRDADTGTGSADGVDEMSGGSRPRQRVQGRGAGIADADVDVMVHGGWSRVPLSSGGSGAASERPSTSGPRNAVVPGALRGAEAAWRDHGRLAWADLYAGSLAAAAGHEVTPRMAEVYRLVESRGHRQALERIIGTPHPPEAGTTIRMPTLGSTLAALAAGGAGVLYGGELADRLVAAARREGAPLCLDDLAVVRATVDPALRYDLGDLVVRVPGAPSQAPIAARLLAAVTADTEPGSRAFAEIVAPLTERELTDFCALGPARPHGTAVSTAVDGAGVSATVVHSLAGVQFGTGWVAGDTGVAFGNRVGTALSDRADLPGCNRRPGAVLPHTLSAAHVRRRRHGTGWLTLATPGGDRQVQWLAQAVQRFRLGARTTEIAAGPRWFVCPSSDERFGVPAGIGEPWYAFAEPGVRWRGDGRVAGYKVRGVDSVGGGVQAATGGQGAHPAAIEVASDPRAAGAALTLP